MKLPLPFSQTVRDEGCDIMIGKGFTDIVIALDVAGEPVAQALLLFITQVMASLLSKLVVV